MKPTIGVTGPDQGGRSAWIWTKLAVLRAGGRPRRITPKRPADAESCDGLILGGGVHVGMKTHPSEARDALELRLAEQALSLGIPTLGICRGAQVMNVALGGTLVREIENNVRTLVRQKRIHVRTPSQLADTLRASGELLVNALHEHAVDRLGRGLVVSATDDAGVVQAIEHPGDRFFIGVQWHPEYLPQSAVQRRLFRALVTRATALREAA